MAGPETRDGIPIPDRPAWQTVWDLLPFMWLESRWDLRRRVIAAVACLVVVRAIGLYIPFIYKDIVDSLSAGASPQQVMLWTPVALILAWGGLQIFYQLTSFGQQALLFRVSEALDRTLSTRAFAHVTSLSMGFHLKKRTDSLARIVRRGASYADFLLRIVIFDLLPMVIEFFVITVLIIVNFGWLYAVIILTSGGIYLVFTGLVAEWRKKYQRALIEAGQESGTKFFDAITNVESVKNFTNEDHEYRRYDRSLKDYEDASVRDDMSASVFGIGQGLVYNVTLVALMIMVAQDVMAGSLTVGSLVLIMSLLAQFYRPVQIFAAIYQNIREALVDSEQLLGILAMKPEVDDRPGAPDLVLHRGAIRFENVRFGYTESRLVLHDVNFTVPAGAKVGIVGRTGAGKSTIAKLLLRYYDVQSGSIRIDDQDIRTVTQHSLRASIGIVPQETALFNETIAYNIAYGWPDATRAEIVEAAKRAQLHEAIVAKENGYDTLVGERGLKLSGGEKQRVAIARALLKNPAILILDEATSSLDSETERDIQDALDLASRDRTTVVIAHRLSTLQNADRILVLEDGAIAEDGTHEDLLALGGIYASLWNRQAMPGRTRAE